MYTTQRVHNTYKTHPVVYYVDTNLYEILSYQLNKEERWKTGRRIVDDHSRSVGRRTSRLRRLSENLRLAPHLGHTFSHLILCRTNCKTDCDGL
nr:MAG: hypothetical protein [Apis mellifera filamentous virus]